MKKDPYTVSKMIWVGFVITVLVWWLGGGG